MELGCRVKDKITGFKGIATGICKYITGCDRILVTPPVDKEGKYVESEWIDIQRLSLVGGKKLSIKSKPNGSMGNPPIK